MQGAPRRWAIEDRGALAVDRVRGWPRPPIAHPGSTRPWARARVQEVRGPRPEHRRRPTPFTPDHRPPQRAPRGSATIDWAEVYRSTYRDLVRFLHRKVWDDERAQELAQETFVRALKQEPDDPRAWLFHVAGNLARDEARLVLRRKRHLVLLRGEAERAASVPPEAPAELERRERQARLRRALERLGERDREVLLLWDAGLSYPEIAAQTGLAPGAIGTTLARARKRLVEAHTALEGEHAARG